MSGSETTIQVSVLASRSKVEMGNFPTSVCNLPSPVDANCKGGGGGTLRTRDLNLLPLARATFKT